MKKDITNLQASIRDRLKNKAKEINRQISELMQYYAMECFLYRLSQRNLQILENTYLC